MDQHLFPISSGTAGLWDQINATLIAGGVRLTGLQCAKSGRITSTIDALITPNQVSKNEHRCGLCGIGEGTGKGMGWVS